MSLMFDRISGALDITPWKSQESSSEKKRPNPFQLTFQELDEITEVGIYLQGLKDQSNPS